MLPKIKDPLVVELERIVKDDLAIPCTFIEANLREAKFGLDQIKAVDFPVLIYVTTAKNETDIAVTNNMIRTAEIYCVLLNRPADLKTSDYKSSDVDADVYQMYQLGQNLQYWINKSVLSRSNSEDNEPCGVVKWKSDPIYAFGDVHAFGQGLTFSWRVNTGVDGYHKRVGDIV